MYNEVFAECPSCGGQGYMQIKPQIVLGFGGFDLRDLRTFEEVESEEDLRQLHVLIKEDSFVCDNCKNVFNPLKDMDNKKELIKELFTVDGNENYDIWE